MPKKNNTDERQNELDGIIDDILNDEEQMAQEEANRANDNDLLIDNNAGNNADNNVEENNDLPVDPEANGHQIEGNQPEGERPEVNREENAEEERKKEEERKQAEERKRAEELKAKVLEDSVNMTMLADRLNTFNGMFQTNLDYGDLTSSVMNAWLFIKSDNKMVQADGKAILGDMFKRILSDAFAVERKISYKEHRLPDYAEIIRSANELLRVAMYTQTDLYTRENNKELFDVTAFGGLSAKEMAELATGDVVWGMEMSAKEKLALDNKFAELSPKEVAEILSGNIEAGSDKLSKEEKQAIANTVNAWDLDQKSDAAWEIQSADAKAIAEKWSKEDKPYEKLIEEMKALTDNGKNSMDGSGSKDIYNKLAAAEWMLLNDDKMMIDNPDDPYNRTPNWGNRYWKAIIQAREALNIPKHTSMRELIQNDYAACSKGASSAHYNERQIAEQVLDPDAREVCDSLEAQKSEFKIQREAIKNNVESKEPRPEDLNPDVHRYPYPVKEENEYEKHRNAEKENNFIKEKGPQEKMMGIDK